MSSQYQRVLRRRIAGQHRSNEHDHCDLHHLKFADEGGDLKAARWRPIPETA
jgi:hypothetical protein